ncbi:hypothetical protein DNK47_01595 [Mycoplasma wenyonii]|uniref:Uncharacterized protein n=1 Tax=Mycoplasma wenyonii TaxID=65123 RepID=A0A328PJT6_9MOLU|nr:hypothetical protein [Mycoplasma wenyonii]RAO95082.1 hypothetical protein DNK47_01595 [Mycoplasma wenyonii]
MLRKSQFEGLAQKVIKNYYREFAGSLQNNSHSQALLYAQKIESLRANFLNYLEISYTHLASIQPNRYYLERIIINFLDSKSRKWELFTNCSDFKFKTCCTYSLEEFLKKDKIVGATLVCLGDQTDPSLISEVGKKLSYFQERNQAVYSYLISKELNTLKKQSLQPFSFVCYDPSVELNDFGSVLFGFQKNLQLNPVFLGSGGASFDHQTSEIKLKKIPYLLEIGTQNLISWLVLAEYFDKLSQKSNIPLDSIIRDVS